MFLKPYICNLWTRCRVLQKCEGCLKLISWEFWKRCFSPVFFTTVDICDVKFVLPRRKPKNSQEADDEVIVDVVRAHNVVVVSYSRSPVLRDIYEKNKQDRDYEFCVRIPVEVSLWRLWCGRGYVCLVKICLCSNFSIQCALPCESRGPKCLLFYFKSRRLSWFAYSVGLFDLLYFLSNFPC